MINWRIRYFFENLLRGDESWAKWRARLFLLLCLALVFVQSLAFERQGMSNLADRIIQAMPILKDVPKPVFYLFIWPFVPANWKYLIAPLLALLSVVFVASRYVADIYEIEDDGLCLRYVFAGLLGFRYPKLSIKAGKKDIKEDETNLIDVIGGPGYINVDVGNVVLLERLRSPSDIKANGKHFIRRNETIREIASLDEHQGEFERIPAITKDGILVEVLDVVYRYRLRSGPQAGARPGHSSDDPYPYSVKAVRNMAYNRFVTEEGLQSWHDAVGDVVRWQIIDYVRSHQFDALTYFEPEKKNPRHEAKKIFEAVDFRERMKHIGAELLWVEVGHYKIMDELVTEQRIDTWQARWIGDMEVRRAYGEAQRMVYQELGRAEAQAEVLMSIIHALDNAQLGSQAGDNLQNLILIKTAQILESLAENDLDNDVQQINMDE